MYIDLICTFSISFHSLELDLLSDLDGTIWLHSLQLRSLDDDCMTVYYISDWFSSIWRFWIHGTFDQYLTYEMKIVVFANKNMEIEKSASKFEMVKAASKLMLWNNFYY